MLPALVDLAGPTQLASIPGRVTTQASLLLRSAQRIARHRNQAFAVLFVDVVQAFYRSIRELLFATHDMDDESVARLVRAAGLPPAAMHELSRQIRERAPILEQAGVSRFTQLAVREAYRAPWFVCSKAEQVAFPCRSVFSGQPLADILFEMLMSDVLSSVRSALLADGWGVPIPSESTRSLVGMLHSEPPQSVEHLLDIAFADDGTFAMCEPSSEIVCCQAGDACRH